MKTCFKCGVEKDRSCFYAHKMMSDGLLGKCKSCTREDSRKNQEKVGLAYDRSEKGVFRIMYKTQKRNQKIRGHGVMPYTKEQLITWCKENGFDSLFCKWRDSGFNKLLKPSMDRIDDFKGYSFDNVRLVTWGDNRKHQADDMKRGVSTSGMCCRKVRKVDGDGNLICEYVSIASAQRDCGYKLYRQLKFGTKCRNGFHWEH